MFFVFVFCSRNKKKFLLFLKSFNFIKMIVFFVLLLFFDSHFKSKLLVQRRNWKKKSYNGILKLNTIIEKKSIFSGIYIFSLLLCKLYDFCCCCCVLLLLKRIFEDQIAIDLNGKSFKRFCYLEKSIFEQKGSDFEVLCRLSIHFVTVDLCFMLISKNSFEA